MVMVILPYNGYSHPGVVPRPRLFGTLPGGWGGVLLRAGTFYAGHMGHLGPGPWSEQAPSPQSGPKEKKKPPHAPTPTREVAVKMSNL